MGDRSQAIVSDAGDTDTRASLHAKTLLRALGVSAATWLGSELGHVARFPDIGAAIVFPPYAILTTVLLLTPPRRWWIYILAAFVGHVLTAPVSGDSVPAAFVASMEIANATRALTAVIMLRALGESRPRFDKLEGTAIFLVVAGVLAPAAGAFLGAAIVLAGPTERGIESYWRIWEAWFLSNAVTGVTLLPLMLVAAQRGLVRWRPANVRRVAEALILGSSVVAVSVLVLSTDPTLVALPARLYAPLPFLLWAAIRFGPGATCASLLVVVTSAIVGVMTRWGPFATQPGDEGVLSLYTFLAFTSVPCVLLAALVKEREQVLSELHTDVEGRKHAQRAWEEGEKRMALAASSASLGFWACSLPAESFWFSDHAKRVLGFRASVEPTREELIAMLHTDDRERLAEQWQATLDQHSTFDAEFRILRDNGDIRWISSKGRPESSSGAATQMVGVVIDVTDRKHAELELQARRRELSHLGRVATVGQLSGALAHELRQPLTAILFNARAAERLLESENPDLVELRAIIADIAQDDARAGDVIARLRHLLKKDGSAFAQLHLNQVVGDSLDIAHHDLIARGIIVTRELEWTLPPIYGDRVELQQVMVNLVMNACDAMRGSSPSDRRLQVGTSCDDAGFVVAYVTDHGTGIVQRDVEQVFEPFVTSKHDGLGLGLAICRTIVTAHRGRLWATNNPDGGATFFLALPPCAAS